MHDAVKAKTVFTMTLCYEFPVARAPLNEGQNIQRKAVPMNARV